MMSVFRLALALIISIVLAPCYLIVGLSLLLTSGLGRCVRLRKKEIALPSPRLETATLIILNWNGKELLKEGLPSVLRAVAHDGRAHEILVVDNGSHDGSAAFVQENFPEVRLLVLPENLGFGEGNNRGVSEARNDVVILLNNDMVLDEGFIRPLLEGFSDDVLAVTGQIFFQDKTRRREETGKTSGRWSRGRLELTHDPVWPNDPEREYQPVLWAGGGSTAYDRRKFLALGGFHQLYSPAYVEDVDLSFRGWKRGWKSLFTPRSVVYHKHRASSRKRFSGRRVDALVRRNHFIFIWKNLTDLRTTFTHVLFLPWAMLRLYSEGGWAQLAAFFRAMAHLPLLLTDRWRLSAATAAGWSDTDIFAFTRQRSQYFEAIAATDRRQVIGMEVKARRPLNVLMITAYLPQRGFHAGGVRMLELIRGLSARHRITLLTFLETEAERPFVAEAATYCEEVRAILRRPLPESHLFSYEPYEEFYVPDMDAAVRGALESRSYDLIHYEYPQMCVYVPPQTTIKKVLTNHEVGFAAHYRKYRHTRVGLPRIKAYYNYLQVLNRELQACARVDKVLCVSREDAAALARYVPSGKIAVAPMGVDLEYFRPDATPEVEENSLIFVGGFRHYPNVDGMLFFHQMIWPLILNEAPDARIYIVGSMPSDEILRLGREKNIIVTGQVADLRPYLERAAVYVAPLRLGVGMRGKVLEAWAMHKPMVATRLAAAGLEHAVDGENIYIADEPQRFAERVLHLLRHPEDRARLAANAAIAIQSYDWSGVAARIEKVYRDLMKTNV
ncbi:MAG: glycosyltransferase [Acidobacteria bacterium]|nr:glycosyltransferase [Acidobacteriota bacterium]MBI3656673.1 glycosyltransferase [Acidobacteriota bacterium]